MDDGFVDDTTAAPSISEHVLTVAVGAPGEEEDGNKDDNDDEDTGHDAVCPMHLQRTIIYSYIRPQPVLPLLLLPSPPPPPMTSLSTPEGYLAGTRLGRWQKNL